MAAFKEVRVRDTGTRTRVVGDFYCIAVELPDPEPGEVQVENLWMSLDPYMKECLEPASRLVPDWVNFFPGAALPGAAVGRVLQSRHQDFAAGDFVFSMLGWRERFNAPADKMQKIAPDGLPVQSFLSVLGQTGLTAYVGMRFAAVKPGETVFVSAAAGSVGSVACQIAKMRGARVIGTARGAEKIAFLKEIGVDEAIDYRATPDLHAAIRQAAPDGLDVYFDNVGGDQLAIAVDCTRPFARVILCGVIGDDGTAPRPNLGLAIPNHIMFQGFSARYYLSEMPAFREEAAVWVRNGQLRSRETVQDGVESAPSALFRLLSGENIGKMLVKLQ